MKKGSIAIPELFLDAQSNSLGFLIALKKYPGA
jgi:hypothetical protein